MDEANLGALKLRHLQMGEGDPQYARLGTLASAWSRIETGFPHVPGKQHLDCGNHERIKSKQSNWDM